MNIPAGVDSGTRIRLSGKGEAGLRGAPAGDLYIFVTVSPHPIFMRDGNNLYMKIPVPMTVAALGDKIEVPTIGIGASQDCDGQILVTDDLIGLTSNTPRFVKKYLNIRKLFNKTILKYRRDVINRKFPTKKNLY